MRAFLCAAAVIALAGSAAAQSPPQDLDRLKKLLDEKLGSPSQRTRSVVRPEKPLQQDDFYVIEPDGTVRDPSGQTPQKRSSMGGELVAAAGRVGGRAEDRGPLVLAQGEGRRAPTQIKRDSYVVQLRSDLTSEELDRAIATLRDKYGLEITRSNNSLGILHVSPMAGSTRSAGTGATR